VTGRRRGPPPRKELALARAYQARYALPKNGRPSLAEIAAQHGVSPRHVLAVHKKHRALVTGENRQRIEKKLEARFNVRNTMTRDERRHRDEQLEAGTQSTLTMQAALRVTRLLTSHVKKRRPK